MTKYRLVIETVVSVPDDEKVTTRVAKQIAKDYKKYLPEDCGSFLPEGAKFGKVNVVLDVA